MVKDKTKDKINKKYSYKVTVPFRVSKEKEMNIYRGFLAFLEEKDDTFREIKAPAALRLIKYGLRYVELVKAGVIKDDD